VRKKRKSGKTLVLEGTYDDGFSDKKIDTLICRVVLMYRSF